MSDASLFRWITIAVAVANIVVTATHRAAARRAAREAAPAPPPAPAAAPPGPDAPSPARSEGRVALLRPIGLVIWLVILGYLINPAWMAWASVPLPRAVAFVGTALSVVSVPLVFWTLRHLGPNLSREVVPPPRATLVTTGPYGLVRHPWYAALLVFLVGFALLWSSWLLAVLVAGRTVYYVKRSQVEELALTDLFGDAYRDYARRVARFVPGVRA